MLPEAEYAFKQAVALCPESSEGSFRLAELYMKARCFEEARKLMADYILVDEYNGNAKNSLRQIEDLKRNDERRTELEKKRGADILDSDEALELLELYAKVDIPAEARSFGGSLQATANNVASDYYFKLGVLFSSIRQMNLAQDAATMFTTREPSDWRGWIELGWVYLNTQNKYQEACGAGGEVINWFYRDCSFILTGGA